jgi:hypothetical protein
VFDSDVAGFVADRQGKDNATRLVKNIKRNTLSELMKIRTFAAHWAGHSNKHCGHPCVAVGERECLAIRAVE